MKSFSKYLTESKKTYSFKIRIANCDLEKDTINRIETGLKQFDLVSLSKPKNYPPEDRSIEFPKVGTCEVKEFDAEVNYPTVDMAIRQAVAHAAGLSLDHITAYTKVDYENRLKEIDRIEKAKKQGAVLGKDNLESEDKPASSMDMLKDLESRKYEFANPNKERAKTTNELPQGNTSPVGTNKPKLPEVGKRK